MFAPTTTLTLSGSIPLTALHDLEFALATDAELTTVRARAAAETSSRFMDSSRARCSARANSGRSLRPRCSGIPQIEVQARYLPRLTRIGTRVDIGAVANCAACKIAVSAQLAAFCP